MRRTASLQWRALGLFASISLLTLFVGVPAQAFCRSITQNPPPGYNPAVSGCYAGDGGGTVYQVYWKNLCVSYSLQKDASPKQQITLADAKAVAAQAFKTWSQAACTSGGVATITASEMEPADADGVDCSETQYNPYGPNQNAIIFRDNGWPDQGDSVNTLGFTTVTFDATNGAIYDADIEINSSTLPLSAFPPAPAGGYDVLSIMTHEAGHFLGLAHSNDTSAIMYAFYHNATALAPDDANGICSINLADGTRATSTGPVAPDACCAVPRHGFASVCAPEDGTGKVIMPAANAPEEPLVAACGTATSTGGETVSTGSDSSGHGGGCALTPGPSEGRALSGGFGLALFGVGLLARRWKSRRRNWRRAHALSLACTGALLCFMGTARASVAVAVLFDDLVRTSAAVAVVTPLDGAAGWEHGRIYTQTHLRVDRTIAGSLPEEIWVRTRGGIVGGVGQIVEGEATFALGRSSLVFLRPRMDPSGPVSGANYVVVERAQGQFVSVAGGDGQLRLEHARAGLVLPRQPTPPGPDAGQKAEAPLAETVLQGRAIEEAATDIAAVWAALHTAK